ncbi:hypothetical protein SAMN05216464_101481 [Mucilaginibacter pineti]|uniref:Uncharacterized protein n=1 Tax=Mucilaginibacter pineti TaxID=1391627 RepID=A0A1G6TZV9_9SPHI|nr:hypothetical protein SAMN05216464_101481 [Mucilaginibacter pineti]
MTSSSRIKINGNAKAISLNAVCLPLPVTCRLSDFQKQFKITRALLMKKAHFKSITTYHKCIDHLIKLGYITYLPNYDSYQGSLIEIKL